MFRQMTCFKAKELNCRMKYIESVIKFNRQDAPDIHC